MGQVYQATDTKLNREVALKILPEVFAEGSDRLARFEREAKVLASLNHPNIAAIYGLEEAESTRALVLELVEGRRWRIGSSRDPFHWMKHCRSPNRSPKRWKRLRSSTKYSAASGRSQGAMSPKRWRWF